jgi:hypothetical protein
MSTKELIGWIVMLILLILVITNSGCCDYIARQQCMNKEKEFIVNDERVTEVNIDGCQYLKFRTYAMYYGFCHKGNCTNSIHNYNKEK